MDTPATGSQKSEFEADKHEQENLTSVTPAEDLDIDDETKNALNFADLQHAVLELSDFRPIAGPAAVLLERANELYHKGYFEDAMIAYQRALKQAEGGLEHYLVLVILLNGGECSLQVNDHRVIQDRGQEMIQRALEQVCEPLSLVTSTSLGIAWCSQHNFLLFL